jgi:putative transposase
MDGAMGKAPLGGEKTGPNTTDRAKKGTKKSLLTDGRGAPLGLAVAGANVNDHKLMRPTLQSMPVERPSPSAHAPQEMCLDKGYDYDSVRIGGRGPC